MPKPDINDEYRALIHDRLAGVVLDFPREGKIFARSNGIHQACIALSDAVIDMVPQGSEQEQALAHIQETLHSSMIAFRNEDNRESE